MSLKNRKSTRAKKSCNPASRNVGERINLTLKTKGTASAEVSQEVLAARTKRKAWVITLRNSRNKKAKREAANAIYKEFYDHLVFYFMRKIGVGANINDLQDLAMTTLEKVFSKIKQYNPDNAEFSTWVYRIALNTLIDHKRSVKDIDVVSVEAINYHNVKSVGEADAEMFEHTSNGPTPVEVVERSQSHSLVRQAIAGLKNESERRVVELRFLDECSYEEIAETLSMPMGTVKALLFRAKARLQEELTGKLELAS